MEPDISVGSELILKREREGVVRTSHIPHATVRPSSLLPSGAISGSDAFFELTRETDRAS